MIITNLVGWKMFKDKTDTYSNMLNTYHIVTCNFADYNFRKTLEFQKNTLNVAPLARYALNRRYFSTTV